MHTGFIFSGQQDTPKLLHTTNSSSTLHNTDYITRVPNMMTSKQFLSSVVSTMVSLFLSSKFHSKSPLQLDNYLLIWNSFTRFILLNYLRFLIDHLQTSSISLCSSIRVQWWGYILDKERFTWASWDWVSFLSIRACMILFFSSVGTRSSARKN